MWFLNLWEAKSWFFYFFRYYIAVFISLLKINNFFSLFIVHIKNVPLILDLTFFFSSFGFYALLKRSPLQLRCVIWIYRWSLLVYAASQSMDFSVVPLYHMSSWQGWIPREVKEYGHWLFEYFTIKLYTTNNPIPIFQISFTIRWMENKSS